MDLSQLNRRQRKYAEAHLYLFTGIGGQCVRSWFKNIEMVAQMIHANEYVCLKHAVDFLIFEAECWYQEHQHILTAWSDFKQHMIARFDTTPQPMNTSENLTINTLLDTGPRTIAWHPQHIADFRTYQENKLCGTNRLLPLAVSSSVLCIPTTSADENFETPWPEGEETWFIHRELPQRNQFVTVKESIMLTTSTFDIVEELVQELSSAADCVSSSLIQEIDQSIKYPQCSEFYFQYVSNWINDLYYECSDINDKTGSLILTSTSSNSSFNSCIIRSISIGIMLIAFICVGMIFGNFGPYSFFYNDTNNPYFVSNLLFYGKNDFDWFQTLAVP